VKGNKQSEKDVKSVKADLAHSCHLNIESPILRKCLHLPRMLCFCIYVFVHLSVHRITITPKVMGKFWQQKFWTG